MFRTDDEQSEASDSAISYRAIMPPVWCALPSDRHLYDRPRPMVGDRAIFKLDAYSRCTCGAEYDPTLPISRIPCIVYGLSKTADAEIEIQHCQSCAPRRRQYVGPDLRECGVFNWSNQVLFTHDLLDEYTSAYSTSETPFVAWVSVICNQYQMYASDRLFVSGGLLRSAWFAFVRLQNFNDDMACAICGPNPENVIWDGVTVAFSKKKLLPSLQPPTTTFPNSPARANVRYYPNQQLIANREIRQLVLKALVSHEQRRKQPEDTESDTGEVEWGATRRRQDHIETLRMAEERLREVNAGLGAVFAQRLGSECGTVIPSPASFELFRQVSEWKM